MELFTKFVGFVIRMIAFTLLLALLFWILMRNPYFRQFYTIMEGIFGTIFRILRL